MSNPNFVSDLVAMAKAMEELPVVQAELSTARQTIDAQATTIQRLELKLIERANEIDTLNAAARKLEVERDHAEHMFLETDDRLNAFRRLVEAFSTDVRSLNAAAEPAASVSTEHYAPVPGTEYSEPKAPAIMSEDHIDGPFPYTKGESAVDPIDASSTASPSPSVDTPAPSTENVGTSSSEAPSTSASASEAGVSVSDYPTFANSPSEGLASPVDTAPTQADVAKSAVVDTTSPTADHSRVDATSPSIDDIGYHNEPKIGTSGDHEADWVEWQHWQMRMDAKYGVGQWPLRPDTSQGVSRASQYSF